MVELARLESVYTGNRIKGSNPFSSAFAHRSFSVGGFLLFIEGLFSGRWASADEVRWFMHKSPMKSSEKTVIL